MAISASYRLFGLLLEADVVAMVRERSHLWVLSVVGDANDRNFSFLDQIDEDLRSTTV